MSCARFNRNAADTSLTDLEGWNDVLDAIASSSENVEPNAIRMVANAITGCLRELRIATDTADAQHGSDA